MLALVADVECSDVATPEPDPTWLADLDRNPRDTRLILFIYLFIYILFFQKCRDPKPRLDPIGGSEPEPGLLQRFHLSSQNILFMLFPFRIINYAKAFSFSNVCGSDFNLGQSHKHLHIQ